MAYYLVKFDGKTYANSELYYTAIAGGERAFMAMLGRKEVEGKLLFDQVLYPLNETQKEICTNYPATIQNFDEFFKNLNVLPKDIIRQAKDSGSPAIPGATIITVDAHTIPETFKYRHASFFRVRDYKKANKYQMLPKTPSIKICGSFYIAINAVDIRIEKPIVVTLEQLRRSYD
jgi:hypothetical protein